MRGSFLNYCVAIVVLLSLALLIGLGAVFSVGSKLKGTDFLLIGAITVGMFIFIFIEFTLIYFLFLKRFKYINVKLDEEAIIYNNKKKKIVIPYDDIISMRYPSIRYTGGWMEIKYNGGKIRLTVVLENIGDFMYNLKEILDKRGRSAVYNEKKSFNFFKTATFSDESWERIYKIYKYLLSIEYLSVFIAIFLSRFGVIQNNFTSIIVFFLAPTIGYLISEIIIGTRVSKRVVHDEFRVIPRDLSKETKFARILIAVSTLICIFIMVLI
ncbi:hypothetical protein [Clostridium sp.]|uniref:hypothetical protein n=1 Tax=Clostridium sp. TaxID=1506 RepID=UPI0025B97E41|nr:hypothetical protein [Clostridium sp.]